MGNYELLKAAINDVIKANGRQEITGEVLNQVLLSMVNSLGAGYQCMGVATPSTNPGTPDQNVFYFATQAGTYTNFDAIVLQAGISVLIWDGDWASQTWFTVDSAPTNNSQNLIASGAVFNALKLDGGAYDVSAHNSGVTFASLSALLNSANLNTLIPTEIRHGGMSIKFVQSSDNKYVQYRLMSDSFNTTPSNWQGVENELNPNSKNLVESDTIYRHVSLLEAYCFLDLKPADFTRDVSYNRTTGEPETTDTRKTTNKIYVKGGLKIQYSLPQEYGSLCIAAFTSDNDTADVSKSIGGSTIVYTGEYTVPEDVIAVCFSVRTVGVSSAYAKMYDLRTLIKDLEALEEAHITYVQNSSKLLASMKNIDVVDGESIDINTGEPVAGIAGVSRCDKLPYSSDAIYSGSAYYRSFYWSNDTYLGYAVYGGNIPTSDLPITHIAFIWSGTPENPKYSIVDGIKQLISAVQSLCEEHTDMLEDKINVLLGLKNIDTIANKAYDIDNGELIDFPPFYACDKLPYSSDAIYTGTGYVRALYWSNNTYLGWAYPNGTINRISGTEDLPITHIAFYWSAEPENPSYSIVSGLKYLISQHGYGIINAADFGVLPTATASDNTTNLNALLQNGNKTVIISIPGEYHLNDTILLYDNTTLYCCSGVKLVKDTNYFNMFRNIGAATRTYNHNISLIGLNLDISANDQSSMDYDSPTFGLRGIVGFVCVSNLTIKNFKILNLKGYAFGIHANKADNLIMDDIEIRGSKDAIHISAIDGFHISNVVCSTHDDAIALNADDFFDGNCIDGTIQNGIIENVVDYISDANQTGYTTRHLLGAWVDWYNGISVKQGDHVVNNGKLYKVLYPATDGNDPKTSGTEPTITTYSGKQEDSGGFYWKLVENSASYVCSVNNITYRNIVSKTNRTLYAGEAYDNNNWSGPQRTLHPDVAIADLPHTDNIEFDNVVFCNNAIAFARYNKMYTDILFKNVRGCKKGILMLRPYDASGYSVLGGRLMIENWDFRNNTQNFDIKAGAYTTVRISNCWADGNIKIDAPDNYERIISNCSINRLPAAPVKGDSVINDGILSVYNGSVWKRLE